MRFRRNGTRSVANTPIVVTNAKRPGKLATAEVFAVVFTDTIAVALEALLKSTVYWFNESGEEMAQAAFGASVLQER